MIGWALSAKCQNTHVTVNAIYDGIDRPIFTGIIGNCRYDLLPVKYKLVLAKQGTVTTPNPGLKYPAKIDVSVPWNLRCGPTEADDKQILADIAANKPPQ